MPVADTDSDHNLLVVKISARLKKIIKLKSENQVEILRRYRHNDRKYKTP